ncbi:MAG: protein-export chaperone SecB [Rickettsiales bacterium]|jgi:preprotein translocase subunit SecB|nr:protein-export chaperone SecB [Rickettsiales bacterium]
MAKFQLISQFLKDFSFESPNVPELFFKQDNGAAKMDINLDIQIKGADNDVFMVDLIVKLHSKLEADEKSIFMIESVYSGLVKIEEKKDEEDTKRTLLIDIPNLLFPSVRAIIMCMTGDSGFPAFAMQPVDFAKMYEENNKK